MSKRGFTLIELLLVTGIISILMSVIFFRVTEAKKKAEDTSMIAQSGEVTRAVYEYKEDHGGKVPGYTSGQSGKRTILEKNSGETTTNPEYVQSLEPLVTGGYLPSIPYSPSGNDYAYIISEDGEEAVFVASLNFARSESNTNSCTLTYNPDFGASSSAIYPDAVPGSYLQYFFTGGCTVVSPENVSTSCPHTGQVTDESSCFFVNDYPSPCECGYNGIKVYESDVNTFPIDICYQYLTYVPSESGSGSGSCITRNPLPPNNSYFLCYHDTVPPVVSEVSAPDPTEGLCSGAFDTDYCSCI